MFNRCVLLLAASIVLGSSGAWAQAPAQSQISADIATVLSDLKVPPSTVNVAVDRGNVVLTGTVSSIGLKNELTIRTSRVNGVADVRPNVTITRAGSDQELASAVSAAVSRTVFTTIFDDVNVAVKDGVVTLQGKVTSPAKAVDIGELASRITGVQRLDNQLRSVPAFAADESVRESVASRIFRDPDFWDYAIGTTTPFRIFVEDRKVTLRGTVRSEAERRKAEEHARAVTGISGVENALQVGQVAARNAAK